MKLPKVAGKPSLLGFVGLWYKRGVWGFESHTKGVQRFTGVFWVFRVVYRNFRTGKYGQTFTKLAENSTKTTLLHPNYAVITHNNSSGGLLGVGYGEKGTVRIV